MPGMLRRRSLFQCVAGVGFVLLATTTPSTTFAADSSERRLDLLEAGLQAEEGVRGVKRLQNIYSHYLDAGLWNDIGDLMTNDVVAVFAGNELKGKTEVQQYLMQMAGRDAPGLAQGQLNVYLILQPIINLDSSGVAAKGTWHEVTMLGQYKQSAEWRGGIYENEYKLDNGEWKISKIAFYHQYEGAYAEYGHKAPALWGIPYHFEAAHLGVTIPQAAIEILASGVDSDAAPAARAAELSHRVQLLNDETAVQNLQHSFGYYLDRKLWDDVADLFTAQGTLELDQRGVYEGQAHIRQALETFYGSTPLQTGELFDHINLSTVVTVAPDGMTASARTSQVSQLGHNGEYAMWEEGVYENRFAKEGGIWKIVAVRYFPRLITDYDLGWAEDAKPAPQTSTTFVPDAPPSQQYAGYPSTQYIGFHYANPVTGRAVQYPAGTVIDVPVVNETSAPKVATVTNIEEALSRAEQQLKVAIGVDAVENLMSSYGYYIDESAWDNMADTYSLTAGAKEITGAGVYVGQERIRKVLNLRGPAGGRTANFFTIHQLVQPVIHVADDAMSAQARLRLYQSGGNADGSSGSWIGGIYENTAVFENGEWKFGVQDLHHLFNASYRNGWARVGQAAPPRPQATPAPAAQPPTAAPGGTGRSVQGGGITQGLGGARGPNSFAADFPPDHKIRSRQYAFPEITEPAFHYRNPVSGRMPAELLPQQ